MPSSQEVPQPESRETQTLDYKSLMNLRRDARTKGALAKLLVSGDVPEALTTLNEIYEEGAIKDPTTGFYNKEGLSLKLDDAISIATTHNIPLSVLYIDGDQFRRINNELNHEVGDKVIMAMSHGIRAGTRDYDIPVHIEKDEKAQEARPGGDEFVVILFGADINNSIKVAQRIMNQVTGFVSREVPEIQQRFNEAFTSSMGIAQFNPEVDNLPDPNGVINPGRSLRIRADEALNRVKNHRRQRNYRAPNTVGLSSIDKGYSPTPINSVVMPKAA